MAIYLRPVRTLEAVHMTQRLSTDIVGMQANAVTLSYSKASEAFDHRPYCDSSLGIAERPGGIQRIDI